MDGRDQQQQTPTPPPQPETQRVSSPPPVAPGVVMPQHAYGAMPPGFANVMHGMPLAFNPMASPGVSQAAMKPADMPPLAMYRPDSSPPGMPQPVSDGGGVLVVSYSGSGGELVKKKRGRPRKYGPDGTMGSAVKAEAGSLVARAPTRILTGNAENGPRYLAKRSSSMPYVILAAPALVHI